MNSRDRALVVLVTVLWGLNFLAIDWGMADVPPLTFLALRFVVVALPALWWVPRPRASWRVVALVGVFMSLGQFSFLYLSIAAGLSPGLAALVLQAQVVFTIVIAATALRELPTRPQVVGVGIGATGLVLVGLGRGGDTPLLALALCVIAALSWGIGNVVSRSSGIAGGLSLTVWSALVVPVPALAASLLLDGPAAVGNALVGLSWQAVAATLYTAVLASLVGYGIFNTLLSRNPPAAVVPWVLLVPPIAIVFAWAVVGDVPSPGELGGGVVMLLGVLVALRRPRVVRRAGVGGAEPAAGVPGVAGDSIRAM